MTFAESAKGADHVGRSGVAPLSLDQEWTPRSTCFHFYFFWLGTLCSLSAAMLCIVHSGPSGHLLLSDQVILAPCSLTIHFTLIGTVYVM